jgi:heme/copper-type cytochrome/quinol oxidase subunit 4
MTNKRRNKMNIGWVIFGLAVAVVLLTSLFKTINLDPKWKSLIAVVLSVVAGAVTVWVSQGGDFTTTNVVQSVTMVYAASQVLYDFVFKGTSLDQMLTSIGSSDTPSTGA